MDDEPTEAKAGKLRKLWPELTDLESARKATMQGVWASLFCAVVTIGVALWSLYASQAVMGLNIWSMADGIIFLLIGLGIYRKIRVAALFGLALYLVERIDMVNTHGVQASLNGLVLIIILILCFVNAIRGAFKWHALKKRENPDHDSWQKPASAAYVVLFLVSFACIGLGLVDSSGFIPQQRIYMAKDMPADYLEFLDANGLLVASEPVAMALTDDTTNHRVGGILLKADVLFSYYEEEGMIQVAPMHYSRIIGIDRKEPGTAFETAVYSLSLDIDEDMPMVIDMELVTTDGLDRVFVQTILDKAARWRQ